MGFLLYTVWRIKPSRSLDLLKDKYLVYFDLFHPLTQGLALEVLGQDPEADNLVARQEDTWSEVYISLCPFALCQILIASRRKETFLTHTDITRLLQGRRIIRWLETLEFRYSFCVLLHCVNP